CQQGTSDPPTF
nr:immunoglobulin light chain junction region [Macaca mulatta]MOX07922.1 immunoglobulin light chain junction region [Macaca mulatta]MOX08064.1 immunoglobulin light chain junction region [Macaca mulatta]MOX10336.1 immunoglobulin light chain junction region [Macaca mulatta]MOX10417.1 immunoglobulin light chain junction region [Macaca mulatta]